MIQYYADSGHMIVDGIVCDPDEVRILEQEKRKYEPVSFQESHALKIFPEAKNIVKILIKEHNEIIDDLVEVKREIESACFQSIKNPKEYEFTLEICLGIFYDIPKERIERRLKKWNAMVLSEFYTKNSGTTSLSKSKSFPIEDVLGTKIRSGFIECPFHTDKTPSMKVYLSENRCHCFSCGFHGDVLDLVMKLENLSLPQAIKKLS